MFIPYFCASFIFMNSTNVNNVSTCIVGIGNTFRSDDGAGAYVCSLLEQQCLQNVTVTTIHQPDILLAEELAKFETVIFIDAAEKEAHFSFHELSSSMHSPASFTHYINTAMLATLTKQLYKATTQFYICAIGATNFEMGNELTQKAKHNASDAVAFISDWLLNKK
jgi:hydrogenase maturation protease